MIHDLLHQIDFVRIMAFYNLFMKLLKMVVLYHPISDCHRAFQLDMSVINLQLYAKVKRASRGHHSLHASMYFEIRTSVD